MEQLPERRTLDGKHSVYCGVCWLPAFALWVSKEAPDYTRCPLGNYTAQSCPSATASARQKAFLISVGHQ